MYQQNLLISKVNSNGSEPKCFLGDYLSQDQRQNTQIRAGSLLEQRFFKLNFLENEEAAYSR